MKISENLENFAKNQKTVFAKNFLLGKHNFWQKTIFDFLRFRKFRKIKKFIKGKQRFFCGANDRFSKISNHFLAEPPTGAKFRPAGKLVQSMVFPDFGSGTRFFEGGAPPKLGKSGEKKSGKKNLKP